MVDEDLRVWLIEVNSSPSMDRGTPVTSVLVEKVLTDLPKVIIDIPNAPNRNNCNTGGFVCVHCSNYEVTRPQAPDLSKLMLSGEQITRKKKQKNIKV